jgi:hypothetical protein
VLKLVLIVFSFGKFLWIVISIFIQALLLVCLKSLVDMKGKREFSAKEWHGNIIYILPKKGHIYERPRHARCLLQHAHAMHTKF